MFKKILLALALIGAIAACNSPAASSTAPLSTTNPAASSSAPDLTSPSVEPSESPSESPSAS
jgi:hypothetical protein